jgi:phage gp29-like protein
LTLPTRRAHREPSIPNLSTWDVASVRSALGNLERGYFARASQLADHMLRDERIASALDTRINGLLSVPMRFTPANNVRGKTVARDLEANWYSIAPEDTLREMLRYALMLGVAPAYLRWDRTGARWYPTLTPWHPQWLEYRDFTEPPGYHLQTRDGYIPVTPGDGQWVILTLGGRRPWINALVRRLAIPFLVRSFAYRDWARSSEVHGMPAWLAKYPEAAKEGDISNFMDSLYDLGNEIRVKLPQNAEGKGYGLELLEAKADTWRVFDSLIAKTESSIAIGVLGQNLTTEVKEGSRAAAQVHNNVRDDYKRSDANSISTSLREQVIKPFAQVNDGSAALAPWVEFAFPRQGFELNAYHLEYGIVDENEARESLGLPPRDDGNRRAIPVGMLQPQAPGTTPAPLQARQALQLMDAARVRLASGDAPRGASGFVSGQVYTDALADHGEGLDANRAARDALERAIQNADDYDTLRAAVANAYADLKPDAFAALLEQALTLADLAGRAAVSEDTS